MQPDTVAASMTSMKPTTNLRMLFSLRTLRLDSIQSPSLHLLALGPTTLDVGRTCVLFPDQVGELYEIAPGPECFAYRHWQRGRPPPSFPPQLQSARSGPSIGPRSTRYSPERRLASVQTALVRN